MKLFLSIIGMIFIAMAALAGINDLICGTTSSIMTVLSLAAGFAGVILLCMIFYAIVGFVINLVVRFFPKLFGAFIFVIIILVFAVLLYESSQNHGY